MVMHPYGFVLPLNWSWTSRLVPVGAAEKPEDQVFEQQHELVCGNTVARGGGEYSCDATWRFKDGDLLHVQCLQLMNLARDHEKALHSGTTRMGMRAPDGSMNCLGGRVALPTKQLDEIWHEKIPSPHPQAIHASMATPEMLRDLPVTGRPASLPAWHAEAGTVLSPEPEQPETD